VIGAGGGKEGEPSGGTDVAFALRTGADCPSGVGSIDNQGHVEHNPDLGRCHAACRSIGLCRVLLLSYESRLVYRRALVLDLQTRWPECSR
jgi:hypothetical protein